MSIAPIDRLPAPISATFDLASYGVRADGVTDNTDALQRAIDDMAASYSTVTHYGGGKIVLPRGTIMLRFSPGAPWTGLLVRSGIVLEGEGPGKTILKGIGSTFPTASGSSLIHVQAFARLANMTVDGARTNITLSETTDASCILVRAVNDFAGAGETPTWVDFENLHITETWCGGTNEGFALACKSVQYVSLRHLRVWNNSTTGVSVGGGDTPSFDVFLDDIWSYHNGYKNDNVTDRGAATQGITLYGAQRVIADNFRVFDNARTGFNAEWIRDVHMSNGYVYDNRDRGLNLYGYCEDVMYDNIHMWNNGFSPDIAQPATASIQRGSTLTPSGIAQRVEYRNCYFEDAPGVPTLYVDALSAPAQGYGVPQIIFNSPNAHNWIVASSLDGGAVTMNQLRAIASYTIKGDGQLVAPVSAAEKIGTAVNALRNNAITGRKGDCFTLTSTAANDGYRWLAERRGRNRANVRLRPASASTWTLRFYDGTTVAGEMPIVFTAADVTAGLWIETQLLDTWSGAAISGKRYFEIIGSTAGGTLYVETPQLDTIQWYRSPIPILEPIERVDVFHDPMIGGLNSSGNAAISGWNIPTGTFTAGVATDAGIGTYVLATGTTANTYAVARLGVANTIIDPASYFDILMIIVPDAWNAVVGQRVIRVGLANPASSNPATNGLYFEVKDNQANWQLISRATTENAVDSGLAAALATRYTMRFYRVDANVVAATLNYGAEILANMTTMPTIALVPFIAAYNGATGVVDHRVTVEDTRLMQWVNSR